MSTEKSQTSAEKEPCKYCEPRAIQCLHCFNACAGERWFESQSRCRGCKPQVRRELGEMPRMRFCPYCGRKLPKYYPNGVKSREEQSHHCWTDTDVMELVRMRRDGKSVKACAEALHLSEYQIKNKLHDMYQTKKWSEVIKRKERKSRGKRKED